MSSDFLRELNRAEMENRTAALTGYDKERKEIKALARIKFDTGMQDSACLKFLNLNGNALLYGEPGTGKTSICYDCMLAFPDATFYQINLSEIISEKLGETGKNLGEAFACAVEEAKNYSVFLLIEEIEAFFPDRSSSRDLPDMKRALTVMMEYLDRYNPNMMVLATTNFKENLDPAIIRRFGYQLETKYGSEKDILHFLTCSENPFSGNFINQSENKEIAQIASIRHMTFSALKDYMKHLCLAQEGGVSGVNGKNLLKLIKEESE